MRPENRKFLAAQDFGADDQDDRICLVPVPDAQTPKMQLAEPYDFYTQGRGWRIYPGYRFDGASVPTLTGLAWVVCYSPFDPRVLRAAIEHDVFCDCEPEGTNYRDAAARFREVVIEDGGDPDKAARMEAAILAFGPRWGIHEDGETWVNDLQDGPGN